MFFLEDQKKRHVCSFLSAMFLEISNEHVDTSIKNQILFTISKNAEVFWYKYKKACTGLVC